MFDRVVDDYFDEYCRLDPVYATLAGRTGFDDALTDYSPAGFDARIGVLRGALAGQPSAVLRERLEAELAYLVSGLAAALNIVASPPMLIRTRLEQASTEAVRDQVPAALTGYVRTLVEETRRGRPPARRQTEMMLGAARAWAPSLAGYADFADALERNVLPSTRDGDGVGRERYLIAARYALGEELNLEDTVEWLTERLRALTEALGVDDPRALCAELDADPRHRVNGHDALRAWLQKQLDQSFDLVHGRVLEVPEPLRTIEAMVPTTMEESPIRYLPPAADLSRPGRVTWSVREDSTPVWGQLTMVHHEGLPGHHLQVGATVLDERLPLWQRHTTVYGHAEGWAVYAEGLMADLLEPPARLGYLMGLRANVAVALADIGVHTQDWTLERTIEFLRENTAIPEGMLYFSALRTAAWPGQALTYACGERVWLEIRDAVERSQGKEFDPLRFHAKILGVGPCGLSVLRELAGQAGFWATTTA